MTEPDPNAVAQQAEQDQQTSGDPSVPGPTNPVDPTQAMNQEGLPDNRDELIASLTARMDQLQAQLAAQASQQAAVKAAGDGTPTRIELASGKYDPNDTVTLTVWNYGDPVPDGFSQVTTSDGSKLAVKLQPNGEPVRDDDGNAYSVHEGSAVAMHGDGHYQHLSPEDVAWFERRYSKAG